MLDFKVGDCVIVMCSVYFLGLVSGIFVEIIFIDLFIGVIDLVIG